MEFITEEVRLTIKIILIDMILSADNAIVIGLAAAQFDPKIRKKLYSLEQRLLLYLDYFLLYRLRTFFSLYLRCPPRVLIEVNLPAFAHLVTVFGSTRKRAATSAGVSKFSWPLTERWERLL